MIRKIYEIWFDNDDGSMGFHNVHPRQDKIATFIDKDNAVKELDRLNDGCNYGKPYYLVEVDVNG